MFQKMIAIVAMGIFCVSGAAMAEVKISGKNTQDTQVQGAVLNAAIGPAAKATQNLSSNKGNVTIGGDKKQTTRVSGAVLNAAIGPAAKAEQNLSSNDGK